MKERKDSLAGHDREPQRGLAKTGNTSRIQSERFETCSPRHCLELTTLGLRLHRTFLEVCSLIHRSGLGMTLSTMS